MANDTLSSTDQHRPHAKDFFLGRQPILNREQNLVAYELLFRSAAFGGAVVVDDLSATAAVIAHVAELGMEHVIGDMLGFVNVDAVVLLSDFVKFLPPKNVILEILETVKATPAVLERVAELVQAGYRFALDDVISDSEDVHKFMPLVEIIKVDIMNMAPADLAILARRLKLFSKKMLAEKVETQVEFEHCLTLGFDYFQGYYFAKPVVLTGKKIAPSELAILQLMGLINSDSDNDVIERSIKQDASLSLNLLRLVNTPAAGARTRIDSLGQALVVLGRRQLQRWLQILLYAKPGRAGQFTSPLLQLATTRGKLLELIAQKLQPRNRNIADIAFTVGIMSLMDALFNLPMVEILVKVVVADEVSDALLSRSGLYGDMLTLVECIEHIEEDAARLAQALVKLQLSPDDLMELELTAFEWTNKIAHSMS